MLGVALLTVREERGFVESVVFAAASAAGFGMVLILFTGLRLRLASSTTPSSLKGAPIALITAGLLSLAFLGFSGMIKG